MAIQITQPYLLQTLPFLLALLLIIFHFFQRFRSRITSRSLPTNWPFIGMLPAVLRNAHRIHEYGTEVLIQSGGNFEFKGPWFANFDMIITCNPDNIHYILTENFSNYPKGPEFRKIFDILGDGIFNADSELWGIHRKVILSVMHGPDFQKLLEKTVLEKLEKGLFPVLENSMNRGEPVDLQDVFQRFTFDSISRMVLGYDPESLSLDLPNIPCEKAFNDAVEALLQRHILPESCWKLQKWLNLGKERKLSQAWKAFDEFIYACIERKKKQDSSLGFDGITAFSRAYEKTISDGTEKVTDDFLRDAALNLMLAGRDTTSTALTWFFFLLAKHPNVEAKIVEEIKHTISLDSALNLVYLHGAFCETLRLYPPLALQHKAPISHDVLPGGDIPITPNTKLIMFFYSMARMESVWGKDCLEFKPERWISENGSIRHVPSFKFPAFNAGPRTCVGKEMSFVQMKMVAASILSSYKVKLLDGHPVYPSDSIIIQMKHGLKVMISKRT